MKKIFQMVKLALIIFGFLINLSILKAQNEATDTTQPNYWRTKMDTWKLNSSIPPQAKLFEKSSQTRYGAYVSFNINSHVPKFKEVDSNLYKTCCPDYFSSKAQLGYDFSAGVLYELPLISNLSLGARLGYSGFSALLSVDETFPYSFDGNEKTGTIQHTFDAKLGMIQLQPTLNYQVISRLSVSLGGYVGYLISNTFAQQEKLVVSDAYTFNNGKLTRNEKSGDIPQANKIQAGASFGLSYEIPINKTGTRFIVPEVSYSLGLTSISKNVEWKVNQIRAGFAIKFSPNATIDTMNYEDWEKQKTWDSAYIVQRLAYALDDSLRNLAAADIVKARIDSIVSVDSKGSTKQIAQFNVDKYQFSNLSQLLNYIFFEEGKSEIPSRYKRIKAQDISSFNEESIATKDYLEIYHYILDIIGKRMLTNIGSKITLVGCNSDEGNEKGNLNLSQKRAEAVKEYLITVWKIPEKYVTIESRNLPEKFTQSIDQKGLSENRRVEIVCDNPKILAPIFVKDQDYMLVDKAVVRTYVSYYAKNPIKQWNSTIQGSNCDGTDKKIEELADDNNKKIKIPSYVEWDLQNDQQILPGKNCDLAFTFFLRDMNEQENQAIKGIPVIVDYKTNLTISKFHLLMPFNETTISDNNKKIIEIVKESITNKTLEVNVKGYTDMIGLPKVNKDLAEKRANSVGNVLEYKKTNVFGEGISNLYENTTPEGRFYNRCVIVEIKKQK